MRSIAFITGNALKFYEGSRVMPELVQVDSDLPELQEVDSMKILKHKLEQGKLLKLAPLIVDDTGLYFEAMNGLPGPFVKWFLKCIGSNGLHELASRLSSTRAVARTYLGLLLEDGSEVFAEGEVTGKIVAPRGKERGWNSIFQPDGSEKTYGEMSDDERFQVSMRRRAFENLRAKIDPS